MPALLIVGVAFIQCLGLAGLSWARMSIGSRSQPLAQTVFFALMLLVAATAAICVSIGSALWPVCGVTFGVMIIGATLSSRQEVQPVV